MPLSRAFAFWALGSSRLPAVCSPAAGAPAAGSAAFSAVAFCSAGFEQEDRPRPVIRDKAAAEAKRVGGIFALRIMFIAKRSFSPSFQKIAYRELSLSKGGPEMIGRSHLSGPALRTIR